MMPDLNERVTRVEARSEDQVRMVNELRSDVADLRRSVEALGHSLRGEMQGMRGELRGEMQALRAEMRADMQTLRVEVREDIGSLRDSFDRRFTWLVGIQVLGLVAVIGALVGAYYR